LVWIASQTIFLPYLVIKLNSSNYKKN